MTSSRAGPRLPVGENDSDDEMPQIDGGFQLWEIPQEESGIGKEAKTVHIFRGALQLRCGKIDPHMRNNSLPSSTRLYLYFGGLAAAAVLAFCQCTLHAQYSDDT